MLVGATELVPNRNVSVQLIDGSRGKHDDPRFLEFGFPNEQTVGSNIVKRQSDGFAKAHSGNRDQTEQTIPG